MDELLKDHSNCNESSKTAKEEFDKFKIAPKLQTGRTSTSIPNISMMAHFNILGYHVIASYLCSNINLVLSRPGSIVVTPDSEIYPSKSFLRSDMYDFSPHLENIIKNLPSSYQYMDFNPNCYENILKSSQVLNLLYNFYGLNFEEIDAKDIPVYISRSKHAGPFYFKLTVPVHFNTFSCIGRICPSEDSEVYKNLDSLNRDQLEKLFSESAYKMIPTWAIIRKKQKYGLAFRRLNDFSFISDSKVTDGYEWETTAIVYESEESFYRVYNLPKMEKTKPDQTQNPITSYLKSLKFNEITSPQTAKDLSKTILGNEYAFSAFFGFEPGDQAKIAAAQMLLLSLSVAIINLKNDNESLSVGSAATALLCAASIPNPHQFAFLAMIIAKSISEKFNSAAMSEVIDSATGKREVDKAKMDTFSCPYTVTSSQTLRKALDAAFDCIDASVWETLNERSQQMKTKAKTNAETKTKTKLKTPQNLSKKKGVVGKPKESKKSKESKESEKVKFAEAFVEYAKSIGRSPLFDF